MAPAFYSMQGFAYDKPAHTACRNLTPKHACAIHPEREAHGFPACAGFDCYGAGQRVTQELFPGLSWRTSDDMATQMFAAYASLLAIHRLMATLALVEARLAASRREPLERLRARLDDLCRSEEAKAGTIDVASLQRETLALVRRQVGR